MNLAEVMQSLEGMGTEQIKKLFRTYGAVEPFFGVKIGDLKLLVKKIKKDHDLSMALFDTGNNDAQYLAGLIADEKRVTDSDLKNWVNHASWSMISEYTVPWIAAESRYGFELGKLWIGSKEIKVVCSGWNCLSSVVSIKADKDLEIGFFENCLKRIEGSIHGQPDRVRYCMNKFIIAVGTYIPALTIKAKATAVKIGKVLVNNNGTASNVPDAKTYIEKAEKMGKIGKKKKMARC